MRDRYPFRRIHLVRYYACKPYTYLLKHVFQGLGQGRMYEKNLKQESLERKKRMQY